MTGASRVSRTALVAMLVLLVGLAGTTWAGAATAAAGEASSTVSRTAADPPPAPRDSAGCTGAKARASRTATAAKAAKAKVKKAKKRLRRAKAAGASAKARKVRKKVAKAKKRLRAAKSALVHARRAATAACARAPRPPVPDANQPSDQSPIYVQLQMPRGSMEIVGLGIGVNRFEVTGVRGSPAAVSTGGRGSSLEVAAAMAAVPGRYGYRVVGRLCDAGGCRAAEVQVDLTITGFGVEAPGGPAPDQMTLPSPDRIATAEPYADTGISLLMDEVLLTLRGDLTPDEARNRAEAIAAARGAFVTGGYADIAVFELRWPSGVDIAEEIDVLSTIPDADGVSPSLLGTVTVDAAGAGAGQPVTPREWATPEGHEYGWHLRAAQVPEAWQVTTGDPDQYVGVIDAGLPPYNAELATWPMSGPGMGSRSDPDGHADHVSGIVCARENGRGMVGVAWGCPLYNATYAAVDDLPGLWKSVLAAAKKLVDDTPAQVINMSLGINNRGVNGRACATPEDNGKIFDLRVAAASPFRALFTQGRGADVVWTLSAGNNCASGPSSPMALFSGLDNVIAVAATNEDGRLASFSNFGVGVEVAAPGGVDRYGYGVLSVSPADAVWCEDDVVRRDLCFGYKFGTSMAAPVVAGIANLMLSANSDLTAGEVGRCITGTATTGVPSRSDQPAGFSPDPAMAYAANSLHLVDAGAAVACAVEQGGSGDPAPEPGEGCDGQISIPAEECEALVDIREANPQATVLRGGGDPCTWQGVSCSGGHVERLILSGHRLTSIPTTIGDLTRLQDLYLEVNQLTGLPDGVEDLADLRHLRLWGNQLTEVPAAIRGLTNLQRLHLGDNRLSSVPAWIGELGSLVELDLQLNQLTELPEALRTLSDLQALTLNDNQVTDLPAWIGDLADLQHLWVYGNRLTSLPDAVGGLTELQYLMASDNQLHGDISGWAGPLSRTGRVHSLALGGNRCLTTGGDADLAAWLESMDSSWDDGC